jgi:epoxyqueuosine reductase
MENNFDLRLDPTKLVPGAKSVVSLSYNYFPEDDALQKEAPKIALYAQGRDYHKVIKKKLKHLMGELQQQFGEIGGRAFVDSAPVHERAWAERSGLGWVGKNSLLLNKRAGSFFFLSELILDVDIEADTPVTDHCGSCTKCIDACPTEAIVGNKVIDSNKCISYLTIELKKEMTSEQEKMLNSWAFGCDICQEVCPWNRFSRPHEEPDFFPHPDIKEMKQKDWLELTEEVFEKRFGRTPLKRAGFKRFKENVRKSIQDRPKLL